MKQSFYFRMDSSAGGHPIGEAFFSMTREDDAAFTPPDSVGSDPGVFRQLMNLRHEYGIEILNHMEIKVDGKVADDLPEEAKNELVMELITNRTLKIEIVEITQEEFKEAQERKE